MEMLSDGWQLSYVAQQLEFVSDSAFITFFRQHTGTTPAHYSLKNIAEKKAPDDGYKSINNNVLSCVLIFH